MRVSIAVDAICSKLTNPPPVCERSQFTDVDIDDEAGLPKHVTRNQVLLILFIFATFLFVLFIAMCFIRRYLRKKIDRQINDNIQDHVNQYMRLRESQ